MIFFILGTGILNFEPLKESQVKIPLKMLNRHGLIAGATGTGKTKPFRSSGWQGNDSIMRLTDIQNRPKLFSTFR